MDKAKRGEADTQVGPRLYLSSLIFCGHSAVGLEGARPGWHQPRYGPLTFAQVVGAHKTGFGGPGPDALPDLVLRAPKSAEKDVPFALVFKALAVGVVTSPGACGQGTQGCNSRITTHLIWVAAAPTVSPLVCSCWEERGLGKPSKEPTT